MRSSIPEAEELEFSNIVIPEQRLLYAFLRRLMYDLVSFGSLDCYESRNLLDYLKNSKSNEPWSLLWISEQLSDQKIYESILGYARGIGLEV